MPKTKKPLARDRRVEELLLRVFDHLAQSGQAGVLHVTTFDDAGLLTRDRGVVVRFQDGSMCQITTVRSE